MLNVSRKNRNLFIVLFMLLIIGCGKVEPKDTNSIIEKEILSQYKLLNSEDYTNIEDFNNNFNYLDLSNYIFEDTDFSNASFSYTSFENSDLGNSKFYSATYFYTNFEGANLSNAVGFSLERALLGGSKFNSKSSLPATLDLTEVSNILDTAEKIFFQAREEVCISLKESLKSVRSASEGINTKHFGLGVLAQCRMNFGVVRTAEITDKSIALIAQLAILNQGIMTLSKNRQQLLNENTKFNGGKE